ncbi:MAG: hypothetical protein FJ404_12520 [Verrucomicrobia bacterium]|nr:hypothetical protein [Verrucomicrobiota bacterium]
MPENSEVVSGIILTPAGRFVFLPPADWNLQVKSRDKTLIFQGTELGLVLTMILDPGQTNLPAFSATQEWESLARNNEDPAGWTLTPRGVFWADGLVGHGFDLVRATPGKPKFLKRRVFCSSPAGLMRFELAGHPDSVEKHHPLLASLVGSLRFEAPLEKAAPPPSP